MDCIHTYREQSFDTREEAQRAQRFSMTAHATHKHSCHRKTPEKRCVTSAGSERAALSQSHREAASRSTLKQRDQNYRSVCVRGLEDFIPHVRINELLKIFHLEQ